jgi:hypothetical protein
MSGRSQHHERGSHPGRGHQRPNINRVAANSPPGAKRFSGIDEKLPTLIYGSGRDQPIEFLRIIGEYCAVKYHHVIANVFRTTPPDYGEADEEHDYPARQTRESNSV